jgi:hypothetical protein
MSPLAKTPREQIVFSDKLLQFNSVRQTIRGRDLPEGGPRSNCVGRN